jgi:alcohol dehydrogenase
VSFAYHNPVRLRFDEGVLDEIGALVAGRSYLLVTHPDAPMRPWRDRVTSLAGEPLAVVDTIEPNPSLPLLRRVCDGLDGVEPEVIVALGGGSVIDSAKFLAAGHCRFAPAHDHLLHDAPIAAPALPLIAIPTTAGTGSDLTKWATIWDPEGNRKLSLNRDDLYPEAVLVDPLLAATLPWTMTLASGLDALSHALESLWNVNANPVSRTHAVQAAHDILAALPRLQRDLSDREARSLMSLGATRAGLAFSNTQTALAHNISYPLTLEYGVTHGIACSFCLPQVMQAALGVDADCDAALAASLGGTNLRDALSRLGVPADAAAFGVGPDDWRRIVTDAFAGQRGRNFIGSIGRFPGMG